MRKARAVSLDFGQLGGTGSRAAAFFAGAVLAVCGCIWGGLGSAGVSGTWDFYCTLESFPEIHEGALDLVQIGPSLIVYNDLGDEIGTGLVLGNSVVMHFQPDPSDPDFTSTVEGTITDGHMEGTWTNSYGDSGTWRAERLD